MYIIIASLVTTGCCVWFVLSRIPIVLYREGFRFWPKVDVCVCVCGHTHTPHTHTHSILTHCTFLYMYIHVWLPVRTRTCMVFVMRVRCIPSVIWID